MKTKQFISIFIVLFLAVLVSGCVQKPASTPENSINLGVIEQEKEDELVGYSETSSVSDPESVFSSYIEAGKAGDIENFILMVYFGHSKLKEINDLEKLRPGIFKSIIQERWNNLQYTIKDKKIDGDVAILTVGATKNGRTKIDRPIFLKKEKNIWKINLFGWTHSADTTTKTMDECNEYCESINLWSSSNIYNIETKECFCWYEPPEIEDLTFLNISKCEQKANGFRGGCYMQYAGLLKDEIYCKKVSSMNRITCYEKVAVAKNDVSVCDNLWDDKKCLEDVNSVD